VLDSPNVSRYHAEIIRDAEGLWIDDLRSESGVIVDGARIAVQTDLRNGSKIQIGGFVLEVRFGGADNAPRRT
jgi:pSer/pThr/pTyr-binding forkhead associated (FHA) protein